MWLGRLRRERRGRVRCELGDMEDVVYFPVWGQFESVRDVTNAFYDFERAMSFVTEFAGGIGDVDTFAIKEDERANFERWKVAMMFVE